MRICKTLCFTVLFCLVTCRVLGQSIKYSSQISSPWINAFAEDRNGTVWMGTNYGLNVYNGATYNTYFATNEAGGISNDDIKSMLFDQQSRLWLCNESGISVMEGKQFRNLTASGFSLAYGICEIDSSYVVVSNRYGLTRLNKNTLEAEHSLTLDLPTPIYKMVVCHDLNACWFAPDNTAKIYITDLQLSRMEELQLPETLQLCNLVADNQQHVWVSALNGKLYCYDMRTRQLCDIPPELTAFHRQGTPLFCICNADGILLIGVKGEGMMRFRPATGEATFVFPEEKLPEDAYTAFMDSKGNVWLSDRKNEYKFYAASRSFHTLTGMMAEMTDKDVRNIAIDRWGHLWIRGRNDLMCCDSETGQMLFHKTGVYNHLFIDSNDRLWTAEDRNTVRCYTIDAKGYPIQRFQHLFPDRTFSIGEDRKGTIWVSLTAGFACISPTLEISYQNPPQGMIPSLLHTQMPGRETFIYMSNSSIYRLDDNVQLTPIDFSVNNPVCAWSDSDRDLWVGSLNDGLIRYDADSHETRKYAHISDGLLETSIKSLIEDSEGNIWLSTAAYIARFEKETDSFSYINDPVFGNGKLYNKNCAAMDGEGNLYFGGTGGITVVHPSLFVPSEKNKYAILLESFRVNGEEYDGRKLAYHQNNIDVIFSSTDYENGKALQYQYRLKGYDSQWHLTNTMPPTAVYTKLPAGEYQLEVAARRLGGQWSDSQLLLAFAILPAPWLTWWAKVAYGCLLLFLLIAVLRFIIQWRLKNEKLALAQRGEELQQSHINLLTNLSHEYRTPLTLIYAPLTQLLRSNKLDTRDQELLELMKKNADHMKELTEQMLNVNELVGNGVPEEKLQVRPMNLQEKLEVCIGNFSYIARENQVKLSFNAADVPHTMAYVDMDKIGKIVNNLLSNAIKYARPTEETGETTVKVTLSYAGTDRAVIQVEDNGPGIAKEKEEELFTRFKRFTDKQDIEGSGIGLHYSMHLARLHKGSLSYQSAQPHGAIFILEIPIGRNAYADEEVSDMDMATRSPLAVAAGHQKASANELSVLIAEDNDDVRNYLTQLFQHSYQVIAASDGQEAIDLLKLQVPDLIVSDVVMPRKDGYQLCSYIKRDEQLGHLPVILLTAKSDVGSSIHGLDCGADSYVAKPFDPSYLLAVAANLIANRKRIQQLVLNLTSSNKEEKTEEISSSLNEHERKFLEAIHRQMDIHLGEEGFSAKNLAEQVNMSYSSLYARIKTLTGQSPQNYIIAYRMNRAMELLRKHDEPVTAICYEVGFSSVQYFSVSFKKYFGKSPSEV